MLLKGGVFLGIDAESGKLNWEKRTIDTNKTRNDMMEPPFGDSASNQVFLVDEIVYIFGSALLIKFDLNTKQASYEYFTFDHFGFGGLTFNCPQFHDGKFYLAAARKENAFNADTICIFDLEKNDIVWQYTFDFEKGNFIRDLKVDEKRIYVLDYKNTLHILEKEN